MEPQNRKVYVITGATSGIGKALLEEFSKDSIVFAGYRNARYEAELSKMPDVIPFFIDMEKPYTISGAAEFIKHKTDRVDVLINAAGCVVAGAVEHIATSRIRKQFEVNTFSHLEFTQKLLPLLNEGRVINISSMASFGIFPFVAPYCASKRALDILFNSMSLEMHDGPEIISVKPGVIATPLWKKSVELNKSALENDEEYSKEMRYMEANALKNGQKGLPVERVVKLIKKVSITKNPKPSYTVGVDAFFAELISKLPQNLINFLIKTGMKKKFG